MPTYTKDMPELLLPTLRTVYGVEYKQYKEEYSMVFELDTSEKAEEKDFGLSGFGLTSVKNEGKAITYDELVRGFTKTYSHVTYSLGFIITREMYEDDLYRQMKARPKALGRSVRQSIETLAANVLNNGFSGNYLGGDSKALCATDHPLRGGGTGSNRFTNGADLDVTSFEDALIMPQKLSSHPNDAFQAQIILKSAQLPGTANNDVNPAQGLLPGGYVVMHWLTDPDAWFVKTDVTNGLMFFWRRRPEFGSDNDWETENAKYKTTYRHSQGWTDWRTIYGSPGA